MKVKLIGELRLHKTMWPELRFGKIGNDWRFFTLDEKTVGEYYPSKALLLADMRRYATEVWGLE
jgi:hypothetical protein